MSHRLFDRCSNDYITVFHVASRPPVEELQPCATDMDTDTADSPMFSLTPMLPMFDVRCVNRPNSSDVSVKQSIMLTQ